MSEEKSTQPQSHAPEGESLTEDALESVSGGLSIAMPGPGCILIPPFIDEPTVGSPIEPVICPIEPDGPVLGF